MIQCIVYNCECFSCGMDIDNTQKIATSTHKCNNDGRSQLNQLCQCLVETGKIEFVITFNLFKSVHFTVQYNFRHLRPICKLLTSSIRRTKAAGHKPANNNTTTQHG
jgi:hypothetical protein